jgi:hypothetical protein
LDNAQRAVQLAFPAVYKIALKKMAAMAPTLAFPAKQCTKPRIREAEKRPRPAVPDLTSGAAINLNAGVSLRRRLTPISFSDVGLQLGPSLDV